MAKICILLPSHWASAKGGAELQAHTLADHLSRNTTHEIVYLARRAPSDTDDFNYKIVRFGGSVAQRFGMAWDAASLNHALRNLRPDVIVQRVACAYTGVAAFYSLRSGAKMIWHVSSDRDVSTDPQLPVGPIGAPLDKQIFRYGVRRATAIIAQTCEQAEMLKTNYLRPATAVVPNFGTPPNKDWVKSGTFKVVWIGNLKQLKQPELFIQLAAELTEYDIEFRMIGRRDDSPWCRSLLERVSATKNIRYLGELELDEVDAQLAAAHLLVNTSLYEGLPNTFIQAWMREVPTLTLNVDPDGVMTGSGIGQRAGSLANLRRTILRYLDDRRALDQDGALARRVAIERYSMRNADTLSVIIDDLLDHT